MSFDAPMYYKFVGQRPLYIWWEGGRRLRNIRVGHPALWLDVCRPKARNISKIGDVVRPGSCAVVNGLEGHTSGAVRSAMDIKGGHYYRCAVTCLHKGNLVFASLPNNARIVYFDVHKLRCCSVGSVAFHSFAWPSNVGRPSPLHVLCSLTVVIGCWSFAVVDLFTWGVLIQQVEF